MKLIEKSEKSKLKTRSILSKKPNRKSQLRKSATRGFGKQVWKQLSIHEKIQKKLGETFSDRLKGFVFSPVFVAIIFGCIFLNTIVLALESYTNSNSLN